MAQTITQQNQLEQYRRHVEQQTHAARDERTRAIRLMVLALAEAAQKCESGFA